RRAPFPFGALGALAARMARTILLRGLRFTGTRRNGCRGGRGGCLRAVLRDCDLRPRPTIGPLPLPLTPLALRARRTLPALFGWATRPPHLDHFGLHRFCFSGFFALSVFSGCHRSSSNSNSSSARLRRRLGYRRNPRLER